MKIYLHPLIALTDRASGRYTPPEMASRYAAKRTTAKPASGFRSILYNTLRERARRHDTEPKKLAGKIV